MSHDNREKIVALLQTGDETNIHLALQLLQATNITMDFTIYETLYASLLDKTSLQEQPTINYSAKTAKNIKPQQQ
ncbi:MAG: hypothetical protein ACRBFS_14740 [Aureispira sp.]